MLQTADGEMGVFVAVPDGDAPHAGVIVCQEAFGVNDHIRDVTQRVAALGYVAAAPDLFHRLGVSAVPYEDVATAKALLERVTNDDATADVAATADCLRQRSDVDRSRIAVVGFCFGGRVAFLAACAGIGLRAAVSYYGGGIVTGAPGAPIDRAPSLECPIQLVFGAADPMVDPAQVAAIRTALDGASVPVEIDVFEGATHGFACDARPGTFHAEAATEAWQRTTAFLAAHLGS